MPRILPRGPFWGLKLSKEFREKMNKSGRKLHEDDQLFWTRKRALKEIDATIEANKKSFYKSKNKPEFTRGWTPPKNQKDFQNRLKLLREFRKKFEK